jgi:protein gp37
MYHIINFSNPYVVLVAIQSDLFLQDASVGLKKDKREVEGSAQEHTFRMTAEIKEKMKEVETQDEKDVI